MLKKQVWRGLTVVVGMLFLMSGCAGGATPGTSEPAAVETASLAQWGIAPVSFGQTGDGLTMAGRTVSFAEEALARTAPAPRATVRYEPRVEKPVTLMEQLAIPTDTPLAQSDLNTQYSNDRYRIKIYPNGNFSLYAQESAQGVEAITLSDQACVQIAEEFLRKAGLLCDDLVRKEALGQDTATNQSGTVVVSKVVKFQPKLGTDARLLGNTRLSVRIAPDGTVTELIYNHLHYQKEAALPLLTPEQALQQALDSKDATALLLEAPEGIGTALTVSKVTLTYYENVMHDQPVQYPVYVLEGGSAELPFAISVCAVKF